MADEQSTIQIPVSELEAKIEQDEAALKAEKDALAAGVGTGLAGENAATPAAVTFVSGSSGGSSDFDELDSVISGGLEKFNSGTDSTSCFKVSALLGSHRDATAMNPQERTELAKVLTNFINN